LLVGPVIKIRRYALHSGEETTYLALKALLCTILCINKDTF